MKRTLIKLLLFVNFVLLIAYMGLTAHAELHLNAGGAVPLCLSSLLLIDVTYVSSCNVRGNRTVSLFCGLLALESWYILLSASDNPVTDRIFFALSPVIWCVSIRFILMFLFQNSRYRFQRPVDICLTGTCLCTLLGLSVSVQGFFLLFCIQFAASWLCLILAVLTNRKRAAFVFRSERKPILASLAVITVLFLAYYASTVRVPGHLSNFGIYIPVLLFWASIHSIILKEHHSPPLSALFISCQSALLLLSGAILFSLAAMIAGGGYPLLFMMPDALAVFLYGCNGILDYNFRQGHNPAIRESRYHVALQLLQQEEQLNLAFANFLHDDILQDLLSVKNLIRKSDRPEIQTLIAETLDHMNTSIRERMQEYHPALLPKLTVKENYRTLLDSIARNFPHRSIRISFDCEDSLFLIEPYDILVYRLLKELVTNIYKHSTGNNAWITLRQDRGMILLDVRDDGTADADVLLSADRSAHRGLAMIAKRVHDMGGSVNLSNHDPHGIRVQTVLPMKGDASYQYFISR